ncbi:MAG TPA: hypothetical protein VF143_03110, partial [Candidatus Nanopelagicales bacterium]
QEVEMEPTPAMIRSLLVQVDVLGWESPAGRELVATLRRHVAKPVVRHAGLVGPAADQAEASAWGAAWDAVRRPAARTAENPMGMAWVAARRAVLAELQAARPGGPEPGAWLPLESVAEVTEQPAVTHAAEAMRLPEWLPALVDALVQAGWARAQVTDAILLLADHAEPPRAGVSGLRWRWVAMRLGLPEWQVRRLAVLLVGRPGVPGVVLRFREAGTGALDHPAVVAALRATTRRWAASPQALLDGAEGEACA